MSNWYLQTGKDSDIVISTRIRLARNLSNFRFNIINPEEYKSLENYIQERITKLGSQYKFLKLKDIDEITKQSLVEKNIISPEFTQHEDCGALLINEEENICIMINEEDHFRIQVFSSGAQLEANLELATEIDEKLQEIFDIAKSKEYGFLTICPTNLGTGLRASAMLHLPGLARTGNIQKVLKSVSQFGIEIRGIYGENSKPIGDIYQISNKQTLGITEKDTIKNLKVIIEGIIKQEKMARRYLTENANELEDNVYRSFGIFANCRKISFKEAMELLSDIKLGTDLGIIKELTDKKILEMYLYIKPANLQKYFATNMEPDLRDIKRAEIIKKILNEN